MIQKLLLNGKELTDTHDIANGINSFFCNIGESINQNLPKVGGHFTKYLKNKIAQTFFLSPVTEQETYKELNKLKNKKAAGPDELQPKLIKAISDVIYKPLTLLFNKSIEQAHFPNIMKIARVIALFKKGKMNEPQNYRPISLLNCFSKILEKLIQKQMMKFITKHNILYKFQFGFRQDFSTTLALIDTIDNIKQHLDNNEYVIGIFLDIRKAFDSINHDIMAKKLEHYGFRGHSLTFLNSYLDGRKQYTVVNNCRSDTLPISYGVPQGSVLGPLLFLLYVNDIQYAIEQTSCRLFADDTAIVLHHRDLKTLINIAEMNMLKLQEWFTLNRLDLSIEKSNFMLFHNRNKKGHENIQKLKIGTKFITRTKFIKYIGLTIDENLTWENHINDICCSLTKFFSIFYNIRHIINPHIARCIYYACIYSKIKYGIEIYGSASKTRLQKLQTLQNKLLRVLCNKDRMYNTNELYTELNLLEVHDIFKVSILSFVHNCVNGKPIAIFQNYYQTREDIHSHNTRNKTYLQIPTARTELGRTTSHNIGARLWNTIESDLKSIKNQHSFRRKIQKYFMKEYRFIQ